MQYFFSFYYFYHTQRLIKLQGNKAKNICIADIFCSLDKGLYLRVCDFNQYQLHRAFEFLFSFNHIVSIIVVYFKRRNLTKVATLLSHHTLSLIIKSNASTKYLFINVEFKYYIVKLHNSLLMAKFTCRCTDAVIFWLLKTSQTDD